VYILLHEQTHIKRYDHIVKIVAYFILCLHWFNPFAWLAFLLMGADMEMSCDERVMRELGEDIAGDYSLSLVRIATGRRMAIGSPLAFGEGGIKERVKRMLHFKKPSRWVVVIAVIVVAALSVGFAFNQISQSDETVPQNESASDFIEMDVFHVDDAASFFPLMMLRWGDIVYQDISNYWAGHFTPGDEIGYAVSELGTFWRVFELDGFGQEYLLIFARDHMEAFRLMHPYPPEVVGQFVLEDATDYQRFTQMLSVTLYYDGTARLAIPPISSFQIRHPIYFTLTDNALIIHDGNQSTVARFYVIDSNTIIFAESDLPLRADVGARYVAVLDLTSQTTPVTLY